MKGAGVQTVLVAVAGPSAAGKGWFVNRVIESIKEKYSGILDAHVLCMDSFYKSLTAEDLENVASYNFDNVDAIDMDALREVVESLMHGKDTMIPIYNFIEHKREQIGELVALNPRAEFRIIVVEGIYALYPEWLVQMANIRIFIESDKITRLARRTVRDTQERGRGLLSVMGQYFAHVAPAYKRDIEPTRVNAQFIVDNSICSGSFAKSVHSLEDIDTARMLGSAAMTAKVILAERSA